MSSIQQRLQQLLDGELDPSEIADDPTLVSLADRLYGIKIAPVQPVKPRDALSLLGGASPVTEVAPPTDMLVEVIAPVAPLNPVGANVPLPLQEVNLQMPAVPKASASPWRWVFGGGLLVVVLNLFGTFSFLFEGLCESGVGACRGPEQTRLNLMEFYKVGESDGWSYSVLSENMSGIGGTAGGIGIPDLVAIVVLLLGFLKFMKRA
jgi:hypothetical protein